MLSGGCGIRVTGAQWILDPILLLMKKGNSIEEIMKLFFRISQKEL